MDQKLNETVQKRTGISNEMLEGQNKIEFALKDFFEFMKGTVLIAHNANFDIAFLKAESMRLGIDKDWSAFCSLKLSRKLLPDFDISKNAPCFIDLGSRERRGMGGTSTHTDTLETIILQQSDAKNSIQPSTDTKR